MTRRIIYADNFTEVSITNMRGRVVRRYIDTPDEVCYVTVEQAEDLAAACWDLDLDPEAMPSHSYTREYVKANRN